MMLKRVIRREENKLKINRDVIVAYSENYNVYPVSFKSNSFSFEVIKKRKNDCTPAPYYYVDVPTGYLHNEVPGCQLHTLAHLILILESKFKEKFYLTGNLIFDCNKKEQEDLKDKK